MKILISYGTANGCTRTIAERLQQRIATSSIGEITLQPIEKDKSKNATNDFDVLIIGSSIHAGSWLRKSQRFIKANAASLNSNPKPTWAFSVGMPPLNGGLEAEEKMMGEWLRKRIPIRGHKLFQGKWEEGDMGGCFKFLFSCFGGKFEDRRDWDAMDKWADEIVGELRAGAQTFAQGIAPPMN